MQTRQFESTNRQAGTVASLRSVQRQHVLGVLRSTDFDMAAASRILGVPPGRLKMLLRGFGIQQNGD
ncbi:MAG: hypothetical protein GY851_23260 [bacterium]|nr:hypothetical protein [bacterium]